MSVNYTQSELDQDVSYVKQQRLVVDPLFISAVALFIYDYLLTLHREIDLIWFSPWTYTKVLFLLVRYLTFVDTFLLLYNQIFLNVSEHTCRLTYPTAIWFVTLKMSLAEVILAIRTWAVWHRSKVVCVILTVTMLGNLVVQCVSTSFYTTKVNYEFQGPMYPGFRGCNFGQRGLSYGGAYVLYSYTSLTAVQAIVLILMIISAFKFHRKGSTSKLSDMIHRDGILFYVVLLAITAANIGIAISPRLLNKVNTVMLTPLEEVLYSVLTTRIVINIRLAGFHSNRVQTELHVSSIVFANHGEKHIQESAAWPQPAIELQIYSDTSVV